VTPAKGERYRKLPGHRRGLLRGASLWIAPDHLLSVRSIRFSEEYKRFHLRDVQAIVVAKAPRFHVSTRALFFGALWLAAYLFARQAAPRVTIALWFIAAGLAAAWVYISSLYSCRCRIYTAVSRDDLPSVYRTWTARKFLAKVAPRIAEVQGQIQSGWVEALESRAIGPASSAGNIPGRAPLERAAPSRTAASDLFVATLFIRALAIALTLNSNATAVRWSMNGLLLAQLGATIAILMQHHRGLLRYAMQVLAIANLVKMGLVYYAGVIIASATSGVAGIDPNAMLSLPSILLVREIDAGIDALLGAAGAVISLRSNHPEEPRVITG
jgi:hypothetical protein